MIKQIYRIVQTTTKISDSETVLSINIKYNIKTVAHHNIEVKVIIHENELVTRVS